MQEQSSEPSHSLHLEDVMTGACPVTEDDRKKAALIRLRKLLPALGRKLDRDARHLSSHDDHTSSAPSFAELTDEVAKLLGPSTKA